LNRYAIKGSIYAVVSFALAMVEALTHEHPRIELLIGYALVFAFGVFTILTRHLREDGAPAPGNRHKSRDEN